MIVAGLARTPEREKQIDFSEYYYRSRSTFVADPNRQFIQTEDGLAGKVLAAQAGTVQADYLASHYGRESKILLPVTPAEIYRALADGRADAVLSDALSAFAFLQTEAGHPFDFVGVPLAADDPSSVACIAVRKGDRHVLDAVNKALKTIRRDGTYDRINREYFPFSIY